MLTTIHRRGVPFLALLLLVVGCRIPENMNPAGGNPPLGTGGTLPTTPPLGTGGTTQNTALEQLALERVNRARLRPAAEAARYGISLNEGIAGTQISSTSKQALALNDLLNLTARQHSQDMLDRDYFAHNSLTGLTPFQRMTAAGYVYFTAGENLAWRGQTPVLTNEADTVNRQHQDLFVDEGIEGRGHRVSMLNANFREVGVGILRGHFLNDRDHVNYDSIMQTQDFGARSDGLAFVTGVVYNDTNRNGDYDFGEGVANSVVSVGSVAVQTNAGGGYAVAVRAGNYTVQFATGGTTPIIVGALNMKVDLIDGVRVEINRGLGPL